MPSSYTASARFVLQAPGENINAWGTILNAGAFSLIDANINGITVKVLTGAYVLTTANGSADEARAQILKFTGSGGTVTIPSVSKTYDIWNGCSGNVLVTTGAGDVATILPGEVARVICDGSSVERVVPLTFGGNRLQGLADPTLVTDAATKNYVDNTAWTYNAGSLPGQSPAVAGFAVITNGTVAAWTQLTSAYLSDTAARDAAALGRAVAMAVAL